MICWSEVTKAAWSLKCKLAGQVLEKVDTVMSHNCGDEQNQLPKNPSFCGVRSLLTRTPGQPLIIYLREWQAKLKAEQGELGGGSLCGIQFWPLVLWRGAFGYMNCQCMCVLCCRVCDTSPSFMPQEKKKLGFVPLRLTVPPLTSLRRQYSYRQSFLSRLPISSILPAAPQITTQRLNINY